MMYQVVRLTLNELQHVQHIAHQTWPLTFKDILTPEQIQYMLEWMYNLDTLKQQFHEGQQFYAVKENDRFIGFTAIELHHPERENVKIHKLYVLPEFHGKGIGLALVDQVKVVALSEKMKTILLNVNRFNSAVSFYEKYGFRTVKEEVIDIGNGFVMDDFVMALEV
jgi:ribosomal protein S18 acetylase RimI-like enzyme